MDSASQRVLCDLLSSGVVRNCSFFTGNEGGVTGASINAMPWWEWALVFFLGALLLTILIATTIRIAMEYERGVIFRLGRYVSTRGPGLYFLIPFIEHDRKVPLRVETYEIDTQEMITKDSISLVLSAVVYFRVKNPVAAIIEVDDYYDAIEQFALTALRSAVGSCSLDDILANRATVTDSARIMLDEVTEHWGVEAQRVEIKQIELPDDMKRAMAREAEAIREKRARIIKASAEKEASEQLVEAAEQIAKSPGALELRRMQMLSEVGAEHNSTIIVGIPQELLAAAKRLGSG